MIPLNDITTVQWPRSVVEHHGLPVPMTKPLLLHTLLLRSATYGAIRLLIIAALFNSGIHNLLRGFADQPGFVQRFPTRRYLHDMTDNLRNPIRPMAHVLLEVVDDLLWRITPVLLSQPLLDELGLDQFSSRVALEKLADEHETELLCHIPEEVLVIMLVVELLLLASVWL